jgi:hypothetical protein
VTILSVLQPSGRLLLYLFNDKTTLNALVCDHSPVYLTIEAKLRDKFLLKVGTGLLDGMIQNWLSYRLLGLLRPVGRLKRTGFGNTFRSCTPDLP